MLTAILSYIAGLLTVLAPCVLPLLPVILGGSFTGEKKDKWRPYIIIGSLVASLILFTVLLKVSTVLIGVDPKLFNYFSGGLIVVLGIFMLFPNLWARALAKTGIEHRSQGLLGKAFGVKNSRLSALLIGAALGPVFSSCSPLYAWVIATVLPANALLGTVYLTIYCLGLATSLLAIALLGRRLLEKIKWATDPKSWFQRSIAILFIIVGLFVFSGYDKKVQTWLVERDFLSLKQIEAKLVPEENDSDTKGVNSMKSEELFNVTPYLAPELVGTADWFNSEPLKLENLRGKVVLIDFWTYSCINCIRTFPYLKQWHQTYEDEGLVIIGVHAPEFAFEKLPKNVNDALIDNDLRYPVVLDNDFKTWQAYKNRFWPAQYLIDKEGNVVREHFGEGEYEETEQAIRELLAQSGNKVTDEFTIKGSTNPPISQAQTPETYLGYERGERFVNVNEFEADRIINYSAKTNLSSNEWSLEGKWTVAGKESTSADTTAKLKIKFSGKEVYLVMSGNGTAGVALNGQKVTAANFGGASVDADGLVKLGKPGLYKLIKSNNLIKDGVLEITVPAGTTVNAFTFAS